MWQTDLTLMLRILIDDLNAPQKNTDAYLYQVLILAGILADNEVDFILDYTFDISGVTISPDPITNNDNIFQALVPLKAACILNQGNFQKAIGQGIKVRDGDSSVDTTASFGGYRDILELGPCNAYDKLRKQISAANSVGNFGAVLSPFRGPSDTPIDTLAWYYDNVSQYFSNSRRNQFRG